MNIGHAIKLCRNQKNLSQIKLAKLAGVSVSYLSLLEQGKRDANFSVVNKIALAMDIPLSVIVFLAADNKELLGISPELIEKLSFESLNLIQSDDSKHAN